MNAAYQIVYYVPNLVLGGKFPIGALVHEDLNTTFIKAKGLPGQNCLGGARALLFMEAMLRRLEAGAWRNGVLSHHIEYGHQVNVPRGIEKAPRRWVEDCLWPSAPPEPQHSDVGLLAEHPQPWSVMSSLQKVAPPIFNVHVEDANNKVVCRFAPTRDSQMAKHLEALALLMCREPLLPVSGAHEAGEGGTSSVTIDATFAGRGELPERYRDCSRRRDGQGEGGGR